MKSRATTSGQIDDTRYARVAASGDKPFDLAGRLSLRAFDTGSRPAGGTGTR